MSDKSKAKARGKVSRTELKIKPAGETGQSFGDRDMKQIYRGAGQWLSVKKKKKLMNGIKPGISNHRISSITFQTDTTKHWSCLST